MTNSTIDRQADGTITLTITLPQAEVKKTREKTITELTKHINVAGFRKGKAPQKLAEEKLDPEVVNQEILKQLLPQAYAQAVTQHAIKPIMNPKIHIEKLEPDKDWIFHALTSEMPKVNLRDYKKAVQAVTAKSKIIVPGKEPVKPKPEELINAALESVEITVPNVLMDQETDRLLAQLLDDLKKLGLSLDQYLATTKRSPEDLRNEYKKRAEKDIKLEFVLQAIADAEKITITDKEIDEAIQKAKDPAEKQNLEANRYILAGILRQQKTLDFLTNL